MYIYKIYHIMYCIYIHTILDIHIQSFVYKYIMCLFCFRAHTAESVPCMQALMHSPIYVYAFRPLSLLLHAEL